MASVMLTATEQMLLQEEHKRRVLGMPLIRVPRMRSMVNPWTAGDPETPEEIEYDYVNPPLYDHRHPYLPADPWRSDVRRLALGYEIGFQMSPHVALHSACRKVTELDRRDYDGLDADDVDGYNGWKTRR